MSIGKLILILIIMGLPTVSVQTFAEASQENPSREGILPFSLTISGGVSLGSYEAGVNWALIKHMRYLRNDRMFEKKKPELTAVTGASAGAINAIMTAMLWLMKEDKLAESTVENNMIRNTWINVGIDDLLPKDPSFYHETSATCKTTEFCQPDGMFARRALEKSAIRMIDDLDKGMFITGKRIHIALLATRERPEEIEIVKGIKVRNQRYVFMLDFVTDDKGNGHFESVYNKDIGKNLGTVVYLPGTRLDDHTIRINNTDVLRLIYASSAFPIAFGKVNINYCTEPSEDKARGSFDGECPKGLGQSSGDFIDGGVFDNVPLGAALAIVNQAKWGKENYFFFISPSNRRSEMECEPRNESQTTFGLAGMFAFVPGFLDSSSDHELLTELRGGRWKSYKDTEAPGDKLRLVVTDRFFPVTGAFLGHFGAFLDQPFREFDYNAGIYDSINDMAQFMKHARSNADDNEDDARWSKLIYEDLGMAKYDKAAEVFERMARLEHGGDWGAGWIKKTDHDGEMSRIFTSINQTLEDKKNRAGQKNIREKVCDDSNDAFTDFIKTLKRNDYAKQEEDNCNGCATKEDQHSETMKWIMANADKDYKVWYSRLAGRAGMRLQNLQASENAAMKKHPAGSDEKQNADLRFIAGGISLAAGRFFDKGDTVSFQPHSIPKDEVDSKKFFYNLIPYEVATDTANGGLSASYLGRMTFKYMPFGSSSIDLKLTPVGYNKFGDERVFFSQADIYLSFDRINSYLSAGAGPTISYLWQQTDRYKKANLGAAAFVEVFHTIRLTAGFRDLKADRLFGHNFYVTLGITDLPGLVYRAFR